MSKILSLAQVTRGQWLSARHHPPRLAAATWGLGRRCRGGRGRSLQERKPPMFDDVAAPTQLQSRAQEILAKALAEERLGAAEGYTLMQVTGSDVPALLHAASVLRDRYKGHKVSYSRKVFIPLTNICRDRCGYCTFRKDPWE